MKKFKTILGITGALVITLLMGCVEKFEADISELPTESLVVEGDIISDSTVVFHLNKELPLNISGDNEELTGSYMDVEADLVVKGSDGASWPAHRIGKGEYQVVIGTLNPEVEYHVEILYNGDTYQSVPQKPMETLDIEKVTFTQPDLEGPVTIQLEAKEGTATDSPYYLWYFEEDWEVRAEFVTTVLYDKVSNKVVRYEYPPVAQGWCHSVAEQFVLASTETNVTNKITGKTIHTIKHTDRRLSELYSIRIYQRNLSAQEFDYYQERAKLNSEMGGLFTPQPSELPTNIRCSDPTRKAIGYVGCNMRVAQHHLFIPTEEVTYISSFECDMGQAPEGSNRKKYESGFQICDDNNMWARTQCVDVTWLNADPLGRPDWWPNPYLYYPQEEADTH